MWAFLISDVWCMIFYLHQTSKNQTSYIFLPHQDKKLTLYHTSKNQKSNIFLPHQDKKRFSNTCCTKRSIDALSVISNWIATAFWPIALIDCTVCIASASLVQYVRITSIPLSAILVAISFPKPRLPPVTSAIFASADIFFRSPHKAMVSKN